MENIKILFAFAVFSSFVACGGGNSSNNQTSSNSSQETVSAETKPTETYDPKRGEGKYNAENLVLDAKLNDNMAEAGGNIQGVKCSACHKLGSEKLVGPGWKGVTERRTAYWIMNFITNPEAMIDKDPQLQAQLELCLVRMPNQSLTDSGARNVLEFMRKNDSVK